MFFQSPVVPRDVLTEVLKALPKKDRLTMRLTCKRFRDCADSLFWREAKAENAQDFFSRMQKLPAKVKRLILVDHRQYTLELAEKIASILNLSDEARLEMLLKDGYMRQGQLDYRHLIYPVIIDNVIIGLCTELITPEQGERLNKRGELVEVFKDEKTLHALQENPQDLCRYIDLLSSGQREALLSDGGLLALREKLITVNEAITMQPNTLAFLFTGFGILALRQKLITVSEAALLTDMLVLQCVFTSIGIYALGKKLITVKQLNALPHGHSYFILSQYGLEVLEKNLMTLEQICRVSAAHLRNLFTKNGIDALRESLISFDPIINMNAACLRYLLTDNGIEYLRAGLITPSHASEMNLNDLQILLGLKSPVKRNTF